MTLKRLEHLSFRNLLPALQRHLNGRPNDSCLHSGHEERVAGHERRIAGHPCPCGSGKPYGACCIGGIDPERVAHTRRRKQRRAHANV